jgi:predicted extracellular nuclease
MNMNMSGMYFMIQALDHVFLSPAMLAAGSPSVTIAHVSAERPDGQRVSDHDPIVVRLPRPAARSSDHAKETAFP